MNSSRDVEDMIRGASGFVVCPDNTGDEENFHITLNVSDGAGDTSYKHTPFHYSIYPRNALTKAMWFNEHLAVLCSVILNICVILVFLRVLGLIRAVSKFIVNIACSGIIFSLSVLLPSHNYNDLTSSRALCREYFLAEICALLLHWNCMATAVLERIIALNMPHFYRASIAFLGPILLGAPWLYWAVLLTVGLNFQVFQYHNGFACTHLLMYVPLKISQEILQIYTYTFLCLLLLVLILSRFLHSPHADDAWERNRQRLEMRTTTIVGQVATLTCLMWFPMKASALASRYKDFRTFQDMLIINLWFELAVHQGTVLFFILMIRKQFRKALCLIFASSDAIRRRRLPNLVVVASQKPRAEKGLESLGSEVTLSHVHSTSAPEIEPREHEKNHMAPDWLLANIKPVRHY